jgi:mRNA interferase MazF
MARSRYQGVGGEKQVVVAQGDVFWADLPGAAGSRPGFERPVIVVQGNPFNRSAIATVVVVPCTRNLRRAQHPGNVSLLARATGLPSDSAANVSQIQSIDRSLLRPDRVGHLSARNLELVLRGIDLVLGR